MKHLFCLSIALLFTVTTTLAQRPAGFRSKLKTEAATPGLAQRLGATSTPIPANRADVSTLADAQLPVALANASLRVVRDPGSGLPISIERGPSRRRTASLTGAARTGASARQLNEAGTFRFLNDVKTVMNLKSPDDTFVIGRTETDELGQTHVRLTQTYAGLPVHGSELIAHLTDGEVTHLNGRYQAIAPGFSVTPTLTAEQAVSQALQDVGTESVVRTFGQNLFNIKQVQENTLCIFSSDGGSKLAYRLVIWPDLHESWSYMIDALTGEVLQKYSRICTGDGPTKASARDLNGVTRSFSTYHVGDLYTTVDASRAMFDTKSKIPGNPLGCIWTNDRQNTYGDKAQFTYGLSKDNTTWNPTLVSAHYNSGIVYDYYLGTHKRNSIDNRGGNIISFINVPDSKTGKPMDNAFWDGYGMYYGNGNTAFKPLAGGLDVAAHEMTHGVVQYTANLEYKGQSGAINESMADIFGCMVDRANWTIGETVVLAKSFPSGALRSLSNPNQGGKGTAGYQPKLMTQYDTASSDNGGVHRNSGIPNYAFYLFATDVTKEKAEKVYYRALANYLTATSKFLDLRLAVIKAAGDLYGATGTEVAAAKKAFDAVGIIDATQTQPKTDIPASQGPDFVLVAGASSARLYATATAVKPVTFDVKTKLGVQRRASVTDDGLTAYYVTTDKQIQSVNLTGTPSEFMVQSQTIWRNVAISRDGSKLAALTAEKDSSVWVYSFTLKKWNQFKFYTPTYTEDTETNDVQYADSFEWDPTGEYIVYDAYNKIKGTDNTGNTDGSEVDLGYWDVGIIKAWDNTKKAFGDGKVQKLFGSLPAGVSIGNPSYAKNSKSTIAFDYVEDGNDSTYYAVLAYDYANKNLQVVYENNTLGFPSYSRLDDRLVFSTLTADREDIGSMNIKADKVTATGKISLPYINAKWPVWYSQGTRALATGASQTIQFDSLADRYTDAAPERLIARATSALAVSFSVTAGPAKIVGGLLTVTGPGKVTVQAYQPGNDQFNAAPVVERSFKVKSLVGLEPSGNSMFVLYPNPVSQFLTVSLPAGEVVERLRLTTADGTVMPVDVLDNSPQTSVDMRALPKGFYLLQVQTDRKVYTQKVVKE